MIIRRARVAASKTLGLVKMEIKVLFFFNNTQFRCSNGPISSQYKESAKGLCMTRNEGKNLCDTWKKKLKEISDLWIHEKVWLKAAKVASKFC